MTTFMKIIMLFFVAISLLPIYFLVLIFSVLTIFTVPCNPANAVDRGNMFLEMLKAPILIFKEVYNDVLHSG